MVFKEEDHVLVGTSVSFHEFNELTSNDRNVLVHFYAPWAGHSQALEPEYSRAAKQLKESGSDIKLAKVDATVETHLAEKYEIQGYPTLKFFRKSKIIDYSGGRTAPEIISWLNKKMSPPSLRLDSLPEIQGFLETRDVAVVFLGEQSDGLLTYHLAVEDFETIECIDSPNAEAVKHYGVRPGTVLLFNKPNGIKAEMEPGFSEATLKAFIAKESQFYLEIYRDEIAGRIITQNPKLLILFDDSETNDSMKVFRKVAPKLHGKVQPVFMETDIAGNRHTLNFIGVAESQIPEIRLVDLSGDMVQYRMHGEVTEENIYAFMAALEAGQLEPS
jgi:protein disulfide-isomerase A1